MLLLVTLLLQSPLERQPPSGFVAVQTASPKIRIAPGYARSNNFTGAVLPGYGVPGAWLKKEAAQALALVQQDLEPRGFGLLVYDAYRPKRATQAMWAWAKREQKTDLFKQGYIASKSGHNHGHTVDVTLVDLKTGAPVDMGTPWDTLDTRANTANAQGEILLRRMTLSAAMKKRGFKPYDKEWWHFSFVMKGTIPRDVPYACFEPDEGAFVPPANWLKPSYVPAPSSLPTTCPAPP